MYVSRRVGSTIGGNMTLRERATAVFKRTEDGNYRVTKTRHGDVILEGIYDGPFVRVYAANNINVYIED